MSDASRKATPRPRWKATLLALTVTTCAHLASQGVMLFVVGMSWRHNSVQGRPVSLLDVIRPVAIALSVRIFVSGPVDAAVSASGRRFSSTAHLWFLWALASSALFVYLADVKMRLRDKYGKLVGVAAIVALLFLVFPLEAHVSWPRWGKLLKIEF